MSDLAKLDYVTRVNRAIDHVMRHVAEPLPLEEVARVACFSPFHFHRIFRSLVGETLHEFVKRVRLERVLHLLAHEGGTLTEIALRCGFSSSSELSRSFRAHYGVPPSAFDLEAHRRTRRADLHLARLPEGENPDGFAVRLRALPARRVAYLRVFAPYRGGVPAAAATLVAWARARGIAGGQWLGYQWEDPEIVPLDLCRYDVAVEVPAGAVIEAEDDGVAVATFPPMRVAELDVRGDIQLEMRALDWLYRTWLPSSDLVPDDQPVFEAWNGEPFAHGPEAFDLRLHLPVR